MAEKRLALTKDGRMTYCTAEKDYIGKGRCNHVAHQIDGETNKQFLERTANKEMLYKRYVCDDSYKNELRKKLDECIPEYLIEDVKKEANGESWIIAYGYDEQAYFNKGGWGKTEPYPFVTSDGKTFIDMYIDQSDVYSIDDENFVTAFNKNKNLVNQEGAFVLDRNKRIYKVQYPNVDDYEFVFIKHIPSC